MIKIILFGTTGMLGRYIFNILSLNYEVICINRIEYDIVNDSWLKLYTILNNHINNTNNTNNMKHIIINCAGIIPQKTDSLEYNTYIKVNTLFPNKLQEFSEKNNCQVIHITTDCVFNGNQEIDKNYIEISEHNEKNIYGITKSLGENLDSCIIRTSIIGEELLNKKSLLEWVISNKNGSINGYTNHYWNGITCLTLANIINNIIKNNLYWKGIRHIYSPNYVSKYELCCIINKIYDLNINIIKLSTDNICNKTLSSIYKNDNINNIIDSIELQILAQKNYKLF
jgi:dTDP-4-dehydrorhamnose reductase